MDNLRSAEVVTATGEVIQASRAENPDLFWALRGGSGNFGVVTSFEFDLHPVGPMVTGGLVAYPLERAPDLLRFLREFAATLPDELTVFAGLLHAPDGSGAKLCALVCCHCGSADRAERDLRPIREFGTPVMDALGPIPYTTMNMLLDEANPRGARNYWKSNFLSEMSDEAIATMVDQFGECPSPMSALLLEHFHGAATRVAPDATAFAHRSAGFNFLVLGQWMDAGDDNANIGWTRTAFAAMQPYVAPGGYVNYLGDDESRERVANAFGGNYRRLQEVKGRYDPGNVFHMNQNIAPA